MEGKERKGSRRKRMYAIEAKRRNNRNREKNEIRKHVKLKKKYINEKKCREERKRRKEEGR